MEIDLSVHQWRGGSEAAGGNPINAPPPPPPVMLFCLLVWYACHVVGTTCNDRWLLGNTFAWTGTLQAPQQFNSKVVVKVQGARHLEAPKNLHLMVPKSRSIIAQQCMDGYAFFHVHCSTKSQRSKIFNSQVFYQKKKCVCSIVPAGQYFSNLKGNQLKRHRSVPRSTLNVTTSK